MRRPRRVGIGRSLAPLVCAVSLLLAGCAPGGPSVLRPAGYGARQVSGLWWLLFWTSVAVFFVVDVLLFWGLLRRRGTVTVRSGQATSFVAVSGALVPFVVLASVYAVGVRTEASLGDDPAKDQLTIQVTGHQWWWEARYPATGAVTANEIHIPVGQRVRVLLNTADVNHSFWVPQLMVKTDLIAGRVNQTWLLAEKAGSYRGQCAEYCGLDHAQMAFLVVAQPRADFNTWLGQLTRPARPATAAQQRGMLVFERSACASCHTIAGTTAHGMVGPNLTNFGSRWAIGAGTVPNDRGNLGGWIANPQTIKPGNTMPPQPVPAADVQDLLAFLESRK